MDLGMLGSGHKISTDHAWKAASQYGSKIAAQIHEEANAMMFFSLYYYWFNQRK